MATLEAIRERVRTRLEEATAAVWTDDELNECVTGALEMYGWRFPVQAITTVAVSDGATTLAVPTGAIAIQRVILADGAVVPRRGRPVYPSAFDEQAWESYAGLFHLTQPLTAQTITIWYTAAPALADVPAEDDGLLVLSSVIQALQHRAIQDAKRGGDPATSESVIAVAQTEFDLALASRTRRVRDGIVATG